MTIEAWTVIGTGIALAALNVGLFQWLRTDVAGVKDRLGTLESDMKGELAKLSERLGAVEKEQARSSGLLEGLGLIGRATPTIQPRAD